MNALVPSATEFGSRLTVWLAAKVWFDNGAKIVKTNTELSIILAIFDIGSPFVCLWVYGNS